jgi:PhzF family phenazine biosynthesis protein
VRAFVVDAFTDAAFGGNPAGVVVLEEPAPAEWMQAVAAELRHSETAFVHRRPDGGHDLRWFTPAVEVDLCGHATLATTHALAVSGARGPFTFHTRSGVLTTTVDDGGMVAMDFPAQPPHAIGVPAGLEAALGATPVGVQTNDIDLLVELTDEATLAGLRPDLLRLQRFEWRGVTVTAAAARADADFVSRFFGPRVGVDEDPVTGSTHCMLAPFWSQRLGRTVLSGVQLSARGGRIELEVRAERVVLRGRAVVVLDGSLRV